MIIGLILYCDAILAACLEDLYKRYESEEESKGIVVSLIVTTML